MENTRYLSGIISLLDKKPQNLFSNFDGKRVEADPAADS